MHGIIARMVFYTHDTVRERCRRLLGDAVEPLTVAVIAEELDTTPAQAARALRQLEQEAAAVRQPGPRPRGWRTPDTWTSR